MKYLPDMLKSAIIAALVTSGLMILMSMSSCSVVGYLQDNPELVDVSVRQGVFIYIDGGETEADKNRRSRQVVEVIRKVDKYLQGNPQARVDQIYDVLVSEIDLDKLSPIDQLRVQDIMSLIRTSIKTKQKEGLLDEDITIAIRAVLSTALATARIL